MSGNFVLSQANLDNQTEYSVMTSRLHNGIIIYNYAIDCVVYEPCANSF